MVGKIEGNKSLGRPRSRWEDNSEMDVREIGWIDLVQDRDQWRSLVNTAIFN
jgi:hypothetical protein